MNPTRRYVYLGLLTSVLPLSPSLSANEKDKDIEETVVIGISDSSGLSLDAQNDASNRLGLEIIDVPSSVEIITKENIAIKGDFSSLSAVTRATGFASSASPGNGGSSVAVRGFNGHGSVVQTYDGVRLYVGAGAATFPADTWTLQKIEVLRGPGSVINGVGAVGATVNYVPKAPTFDNINHDVNITAGTFGLRRFAYGSGGRITDEVAYRIDTVYHETDGYVDFGGEQREALAGSLLFRPLENLDIKLSVDYADVDAAPYWGAPTLSNGKVPDSIRENNYNVRDGIVKYEDLWPRLSVRWGINENITFRNDLYYLTAKRHWRNVEDYQIKEETSQVDRSFFLEILHDQKQLGNRSDVLFDYKIGDMENRLNVGFEVNSIDFTHTNNRPYAGPKPDLVDLHNPNPGLWRDVAFSKTTKDFTSETLQYAVFLDEHLQITEQFAVIGGLRYDAIDFQREDFARFNGPLPENAEPASKTDNDLSGTSWRLGAVYQPIENLSIYGQASEAVDSIQSILSATNPDLKLAKGRQFEIGLKHQTWDDRLQYTVALYDIVKKDILSAEPFGQDQSQIGQQSSQGIEFEFFLRPVDNFDINFNVAFVDPKFDTFEKTAKDPNTGDPIENVDLSGNTPRNVPKTTANLWMNWQFVDDWMMSGGLRYVGERFADDENENELPSYTIYDASVRWAVTDDLQLSLLGKNLSDDKNYILAPYGSQRILGEPRSAEFAVHFSF
ncbi:Ferrichrome outer membrane transporter/phage receptor [BD1-7 clade bacterium]|uniref:Ferrichrome outer membrane transporter/phage receptor n=1 Tax=BD1-7 clade bacterium TaxID=2029982 RepID=A0A5S9N645_9GAMM|nr:Ferrichrome outer membrane transporter/phage receptor [BD1-7 clade bacterium]